MGGTRYRRALHLMRLPRLFIWTQILIVIFVLVGIVIAITKLA